MSHSRHLGSYHFYDLECFKTVYQYYDASQSIFIQNMTELIVRSAPVIWFEVDAAEVCSLAVRSCRWATGGGLRSRCAEVDETVGGIRAGRGDLLTTNIACRSTYTVRFLQSKAHKQSGTKEAEGVQVGINDI